MSDNLVGHLSDNFIDNLYLVQSLLLLHYNVKMVLTIRFRFKVDYCFTIKSYDSLVHYLIFIFLLKPSAFFNRTNIILYVTTSISRRLIILSKYQKKMYIMFKIIAFFKIKLLPNYMRRLAFHSHVESTYMAASFHEERKFATMTIWQ